MADTSTADTTLRLGRFSRCENQLTKGRRATPSTSIIWNAILFNTGHIKLVCYQNELYNYQLNEQLEWSCGGILG